MPDIKYQFRDSLTEFSTCLRRAHFLGLILLALCILRPDILKAQDTNSTTTFEGSTTASEADKTASQSDTTASRGPNPDPLRLGLVGGVTAAGFVYGHVLQNDIWWKGERSDFHFNWQADWEYSLGADKLGHMYFPYVITNVYGDLFTWSGLDTSTAIYLAGGLALSYQTYIEIRDGFSAEWGFSWGDMAANTLGAVYPIAVHHWPQLDFVRLKISFNPTQEFRDGSHAAIIDDYESTTHWLSFGVHDALPQSLQTYWPEWLRIAVGHSVQALDGRGGGDHRIFLTLDYGISDLGGDWQPWRAIKNLLEFYHLPAPAVQLHPDVVWYGLRL